MSNNTPELYELSDEELLKTDLSKFDTVVEDAEVEEEDALEDLDEVDDSEEGEADDESGTESEEEEDLEEETEEDDESATDEPDEPSTDPEPSDEGTEDDEDEQEDPDEEEDESSDLGVKKLEDFYKAVTAEFRANGKEMQIFDPSDIQSLMQQGINYSQKMAGLKPIIAIGKTLKQHGLDDPEKISYLIDLHNKDPKAIAKLIKDSEMDVYEYDEATADDYKPSNKVREETPLDEVLTDLESAPRFQDLIDSIATEWDLASRQQIADNPGVLRILSAQMENGVYDQIKAGVEYQRLIGKLKDIPYIQAYAMVESQMNSANGVEEPEEPAAKKFVAKRPAKKTTSGNNAKKRKAASPSTGNNVAEEEFNPLTVSDEELVEYMEQQSRF